MSMLRRAQALARIHLKLPKRTTLAGTIASLTNLLINTVTVNCTSLNVSSLITVVQVKTYQYIVMLPANHNGKIF